MNNHYLLLHFFQSIGKRGFTVSLFLLFFSSLSLAQLSVEPDNLYYRYFSGDVIRYEILSSTSGTVDYIINQDPLLPVLAEGSIEVIADEITILEFTPAQPGNYFCTLTMGGASANTVAIFDERKLEPILGTPADFDTYWAGVRSTLDAEPIDAQVVEDDDYDSAYSTTYRLSLGSIEGHRAYAFMTVPTVSGVFTGLLKFPAFGNSDATQPDLPMSERLGAIVISLSIHNSPVDVNLPVEDLYVPDIHTSDEVYYKWAMVAGMRAIDYLNTRTDFDGSHVGVYGVSQGAGLAMLFAGVDSRVNLVAVSNPIMSQHDGLINNKPSGFPEYIRNVLNDPAEVDRILSATKYYDVVFAMQNFTGSFLGATSLMDEVTSSETSYVAYNQLQGKVVRLHNLNGFHGDNPPEYWDGKFDMIRRYFPVNNSWPWPETTIGYEANAGNDQTTSGLQAVLSGTIDDNGTLNPNNIPVHWELVSGPGAVSFTDAESHVTTATFSASGVYTLRFVGEEISKLSSEFKYLSIEDVVVFTVCPNNDCGGAPLPVELVNFSASKIKDYVRIEWHTLSEKSNVGFDVMKSRDAINWEKIGYVQGAGDANTEKRYILNDENPGIGVNYYQLVQVDYDGKQHLSEIQSVVFDLTNEISPNIYPNPTKKTISFIGLGEETFMLNVLNQSGQTVLVSEVKNNQIMDLDHLPTGNYFFRFSDGVKSYFRKVAVMK